nr:autotransporter domain-containing protein [Aquisediminimonas sediminicola]
MVSGVNTTTLTNSGTISVSASTTNGLATAKGVVVTDTGVVAPLVTDVFTLNNTGGTIIARQSTDGGATWQRGTAIDTSLAPNPAVINLSALGGVNGSIYGNVEISAADTINVLGGETKLDGIVNPLGGKIGTLNIVSGGTLYLANQPNANTSYDGPASVNVDTFTVASGGKLALQLPSNSTAATAELSYPQVFANTANLGGTLEVRPTSQNGLYANSYTYNNVIDADTRVGTFANVVTGTGTPLLTVNAVYDADNNVDLNLSRVAFGDVAGLTVNETAVGDGIENVYNPSLTGPFSTLLGNLFQQSAANYPGALDQLSGAQYAGYVQGLRNFNVQTNTLVSDQIDCAISIDGVEKCRNPDAGLRLWGLGGYNHAKVDSDINAAGYKSNNWFALLGLDYTMGNFTVGGFGGYRKAKTNFDRYNGRIKSDGWQAGLLAAYDIGDFYVRGIGSYSVMNGNSRRTIAIGTTSGILSGKPDANIWSFYGEGGARFDMGGSWLTPFVGVDYTNVKLKSFTETGVPGANLNFGSQSQNKTAILAGVKWAGNFGGIIPEAKVAYRHDFGSRVYGVDASFADAPAGSDFRVYSPETKRDSIVAGLSLATAMSEKVTGRLGYQGRFNSDVTDHAFYGSVTFALGGSTPAAPPPPPPVSVAPPAPPAPPAPAVVECQTGPYIVFFDFDKSDITAEAASILDNAAANYANCGNAVITLAGHTDKSGPDAYNQALSERRAQAVRMYLVGHGIQDGVITSQGYGESRPLVDTADGVREPQNRRVEIKYGPGSGQ